jgi:hypothetical protein
MNRLHLTLTPIPTHLRHAYTTHTKLVEKKDFDLKYLLNFFNKWSIQSLYSHLWLLIFIKRQNPSFISKLFVGNEHLTPVFFL